MSKLLNKMKSDIETIKKALIPKKKVVSFLPNQKLILFTLVNTKFQDEVEEFLINNNAVIMSELMADGTARSSLVNTLGLSKASYIIFLSIVDKNNIKDVLEKLNDEFLSEQGTGLSFTVNLDGYTGLNTILSLLGAANE